MNKSQKVREFVQGHAGARAADIAAGTKLDAGFVATICGQQVARGQFTGNAADGYTWNADFVAVPGGRKPKKMRGFKAEKRARQKRKSASNKVARVPSMKALADKVCAPVVTPLTHVQTTLAALDAVLDLEGAEPMLVLAWQSHREAVAMVAAV